MNPFNVSYPTGDNMLTALSVARQCHMIGTDEEVVMVDASPPDGVKSASVHWRQVTADNSVHGNQHCQVPQKSPHDGG